MKLQQNSHVIRYVAAAVLIVAGVAGRVALQDWPNIEPLMAVVIVSGMLLGARLGWATALVAIVASDLIIGNTNIAIYTWSSWALIGLCSGFISLKGLTGSAWMNSAKALGSGIVGTLLFYGITNFGVWQLSGMYAPTLEGLLQSYTLAIPFLRNHMISTLLFVPVVSLVTFTITKLVAAHVESTEQVTATTEA